jgi:hypothetical protein
MEFQEIYEAVMFNPGQEVQHETVIHQDLIEIRSRSNSSDKSQYKNIMRRR